MKKLIIITLAAIAFTTAEAQAQNWLNALKSAATSAIDKVTGGALTEKAIIGTWNYSQPGVKLSSSENALSDITGSALTTTVQQKITPYYEKVGIKPGICKFVINEDGTFSSTFGQRTFSGTYTFDPKTNALSLKYGVAKAAVVNWTKYMCGELAIKFGEGLRVNAIAPGFLLTNQNRALLTNPDGSLTPRSHTILAHTPYNRFGEPEELLGTLQWLASDASKFVSGTLTVIDGGFDAFSI